jgi:hypothetical protein
MRFGLFLVANQLRLDWRPELPIEKILVCGTDHYRCRNWELSPPGRALNPGILFEQRDHFRKMPRNGPIRFIILLFRSKVRAKVMYHQRLRRTVSIIATTIAVFSVSLPAHAIFGWGYAQANLPKPEEYKPASDKPALDMMMQVARSPELMNLRYLSLVVGQPEPDKANGWQSVKHYRWYEPKQHNLSYELIQNEQTQGRIVQSTLVAHMPNLDMDLAAIEAKYGVAGNKFFDQQSAPNIKYSFAPATSVDFTQPPNAFRVTQSTVSYAGYALPPLTNEQLNQALNTHRTRAMEHHKNQRWASAIPALRERLAEDPSDVKARLALAEAYKNHNNLNEAIQEFHTVMSQTSDSQTQTECVKALQEMRVLPPPNGLPQQQTFKLVRNGQGMRVDTTGSNDDSAIAQARSVDTSHPRVFVPGYDTQAGF